MGTGAEVWMYAALATTTVATIDQQNRARRAAAAQAAAEKRRADIENVYKVRQNLRETRLAQAAMINQAALSGGMGGSGVQGGVASLGSQMAGNVNTMSDIATENSSIFSSAVTQAKASSNAAVWGTIGQFSNTIFKDVYGGKK